MALSFAPSYLHFTWLTEPSLIDKLIKFCTEGISGDRELVINSSEESKTKLIQPNFKGFLRGKEQI